VQTAQNHDQRKFRVEPALMPRAGLRQERQRQTQNPDRKQSPDFMIDPRSLRSITFETFGLRRARQRFAVVNEQTRQIEKPCHQRNHGK